MIQDAASPEAITNQIDALMIENEERESQNAALAEIPQHLGDPGALAHLAKLVLELTRETPTTVPPK